MSGVIGGIGSKSGVIGPTPSFSLRVGTAYDIAQDTDAILYFQTVDYDIGSNISTTTNITTGTVFTAPRTGHYQFNFAVRLDSFSGDSIHIHVELRKTGSTPFEYSTILHPVMFAEGTINYHGFSASHCTALSAGESAWIFSYGNSTGSFQVSKDSASFSGFLIR